MEHDRAASVTHVSSRKVDRMPKRAKSATDSVEAEALLQYIIPVRGVNQ